METGRPDFAAIEKKWQQRWEKEGIFKARENPKKKKHYVLEMYPYPSASFLHMGHIRNYTIGDAHARFKRMQGFNVLYPMGYDSFGLPAETAAKKEGVHPKKYTEHAIGKIVEYQKSLGNSYDWDRVIASHEPAYYKWNQFFFLKLFEKGLAYRAKAPVNWCPNCKSVLANEEAEGGRCWRCESEVVKKDMEQWFFKITAYADRLLADLKKIEWPEKIKAMQENWIGRSHGTEINFEVNDEVWPIFTTRPDTIYGVTFMVISAQHPKLMGLVAKERKKDVEAFVKKCQKARTQEEIESLEKGGVFTGSHAINPLTGEKVPLWAGNFVLADYGSGMVMAVPAHDQRDFEFAKKYKIPIKEVIAPDFIGVPKEGVETLQRKTVTAIIENKKGDKFLLIKEAEDNILVGGGVEAGETPEQAIVREVKEETGYINFEIKKVLIKNLFCCGFRKTKNKNQKTDDTVFYIKLKDEKQIKSEVDSGKHKIVWAVPHEVKNMITWEHHKFMWDLFFSGERAYTDSGTLINSDKFSGMNSEKAIEEITKHLESRKMGRRAVNYKLRDWMISRQRYWGTPIPIVHCPKCGVVPVPEKELPVLLPEKVDFKATGNPLASCKEFVNTKCPKCKGAAKRETDTMGGFMDSSWYFLRYCSPKATEFAFDKKAVKYWMPVDQYIGGAEHAVMHLLYARFFIKALKDMGFVGFDEPFTKLFNQGILYKDGHKMSKSYGNVVTQEEIAKKYGIDTARLFLMFVSSPESQMEWSEEGIIGAYRFVLRFLSLVEECKNLKCRSGRLETRDLMMRAKLHSATKKVTETMEDFRFNITIGSLMELSNDIQKYAEDANKDVLSECMDALTIMISPFAPHICEEAWDMMGRLKAADAEGRSGFVSLARWPAADETLIDRKLEMMEELTEATKADIKEVLKIVGREAKSITIYVAPLWKYAVYNEILEKAKSEAGVKEMLKAIMQMPAARAQGKHAAMFAEKLARDARMLQGTLSQEEELKALVESRQELEKLFSCSVKIMKAEASKSLKALRAEPGKPGIEVE